MADSASYEIHVRQGDQFQFTITYKAGGAPVDLTGYTAAMVITWPQYQPKNRPLIPAGEIMLSIGALDSSGVISAGLLDTQTPDIPVSGSGRDGPQVTYQLRLTTSGGQNDTLLSGTVDVAPDLFEYVA